MDNKILLWVASQIGARAVIRMTNVGKQVFVDVNKDDTYYESFLTYIEKPKKMTISTRPFNLFADTLQGAYDREKVTDWFNTTYQLSICASGTNWFIWDELHTTHIGGLKPTKISAIIAVCEYLWKRREQ